MEPEQALISNLYLCLREKGQDEMQKRRRIGESSEQFHSVLSGLAARSTIGVQESRRLTDVFIVNMTNREVKFELCRSTKTPQKLYCIALHGLNVRLRTTAAQPGY